MLVVGAYDISTETKEGRRRLQRVAKACKDYGVRVQKSLFEFVVEDAQWVVLRNRLLHEIKLDEDSLRIYFIDEAARRKTEHHGIKKPQDMEGPLIL